MTDPQATATDGARSATAGFGAALVAALVIVGALTALRIAVLLFTVLDLGPEEAQYWAWAQHLAFGYFSKPPMIAWLIAGTTAVCGDGEACVRISAPLLHAGSALVVFALARKLYGDRTAVWAAVAFATLPAVFLSAGLITTDVPLVFAWVCALYAYRQMIDASHDAMRQEALRWAALTGIAVGLGLLAKYAMVYFFLCAAAHAATSRTARRALLRSPAGLMIAGLALAIVSPNLIWNAQEGFATVKHTAANANWQGHLFSLRQLGDFLGAQLGVFGPILFVVFLIGLMTLTRRMKTATPGADQFLALFSAPILLVACAQAFVSRANANWAGPTYVAATILAVAWLVRGGDRVWLSLFGLRARLKSLLWLSLGIHLISGLTLYALITIPGAIETFGLENAFKDLRGWDKFAPRIARLASSGSYRVLMTDYRWTTAELLYYGRNVGLPIAMFDVDGIPGNEFELSRPYRRESGGPVLFVSYYADTSKVLSRFAEVQPLEVFPMPRSLAPPPAPPAQVPWVRTYGKYELPFYIFRLDGYRG
ncbi:MAG: glycosyltransferase family 39 protein [Alphaproteobacteria bacterium]